MVLKGLMTLPINFLDGNPKIPVKFDVDGKYQVGRKKH